MIVGFTGTRDGMSIAQIDAFTKLVKEISIKDFHHGDCTGSDETAHSIIRINFPSTKIVLHPPISKSYRAFCKADLEFKALPYLDRNKDIVRISEILIATPVGEEKLASGTWSTIRYARKLNKQIYIIMPDGIIKEENIKKN